MGVPGPALWRIQVKPCTSLHSGPSLASCPAASILASGTLDSRRESLQHLKTTARPLQDCRWPGRGHSLFT